MEHMALIQILFAFFSAACAFLFVANVVVVGLRVSHRDDEALKISRNLRPIVSYLRLDGGSEKKSRHA